MSITKKILTRPITVTPWRVPILLVGTTLALIFVAFGQRPFREYPGVEYENFPKPSDWQVPGEWTFARLMYPDVRFSDRRYGKWLVGGTNWTIDYPRSDRHLS